MTRRPATSDPFEMDDAAYVLGALSPAERSQYEHHLQACPTCARAVAELAGLPGMLRRLPLEVVESLDAPEHDVDDAEPPTLLTGALHKVELEERRERRAHAMRWAGALTVGAAAVGVGAIAVLGPDQEPPPSEQPPAFTAELDFEPVVDTDLAARVSLRGVAWGTKIQLECAYPELSDDEWSEASGYSLVVHDTEGQSQQVATWKAVAGREFTIDAATAVHEEDIASFEVRDLDGTLILRAVA
jgi:Putative zinc-finger